MMEMKDGDILGLGKFRLVQTTVQMVSLRLAVRRIERGRRKASWTQQRLGGPNCKTHFQCIGF